MTLVYLKYKANWKLARNSFRILRCTDSGNRIWPWEMYYTGTDFLLWPTKHYNLSQKQFILLKLKGDI